MSYKTGIKEQRGDGECILDFYTERAKLVVLAVCCLHKIENCPLLRINVRPTTLGLWFGLGWGLELELGG